MSRPLRLSSNDMLAYATPMVACYFLLGPTYNIVPTLYAKYFGLELTTVAGVVFATRVLDALADPLIGYLSDRHRMAGGARKSWLVLGGGSMASAAFFLFSPPASPSSAYYLIWNLSFFLAYSLMEIPHITWGGELTRDYSKRSAVYSFRSAAIFSGFILWASVPLLPIFRSNEFTPEVLQKTAYAGATLIAITVAWAVLRAPRGTAAVPHEHDSWRQIAHSILLNKPLRLFLMASLLCVLGLGMWQGLIFLYLDAHLGLGDKFASMQLLSNVAGLICIPGWKHLAQVFNKSTVWLLGMAFFVLFNGAFLLVEPTNPWWQALLLMALIHICFSCFYMIVPSLLSDVVDYAELKFRQNRGAVYFSLSTLLSKIGFGAGGAISLAIAGLFGADATQAVQTPRAVQGLHLAYIIMPVALVIAGSVLIRLTPLDRRRHDIVRRRIESRARRMARVV